MSFADATVEVVADWSKVDNQFERGLAKAASDAARAARPALAREGRRAGDAYFDAVAGRWRNAQGRFVAAGLLSGRAFTRGFGLGTTGMGRQIRQVTSALGRLGAAAAATAGIVVLTQAVTALGASLISIAAAIAPAGGALLLLPGIAAGAAAAIATLVIGFQGLGDAISAGLEGDTEKFNEALKNLAPAAADAARTIVGLKSQFDTLRRSVQQRLFAGVAADIRALARTHLPMLTEALGAFADAFNQAFRDFAVVAVQPGFLADMQAGLAGAASGLRGMFDAIGPLTAAFAAMARVAGPFLASLGASLGQAGSALGNFLSASADSGAMAAAIQRALDVLSQLGRIAGNVGQAVGAIFSAADAAGGGLLNVLERVTGAIATFTSSAAGQEALSGFFDLMATTLTTILPLVTSLAGALTPLFEPLRVAVIALAGPLTTMIDALGAALVTLGPAFEPLAGILALVAQLITPLLEPIGLLITAFLSFAQVALTPLVNILTILIKLVSPFIELFAGALTAAMTEAKPMLEAVSKILMNSFEPVIRHLSAALAPLLPKLAELAGQWVGEMIKALPGMAQAMERLTDALVPLIDQFGGALMDALMAIAPHIPTLAQAIVSMQLAVAELAVSLLPLVTLLLQSSGNSGKLAAIMEVVIFFVNLFASSIRTGTEVVSFLIGMLLGVIDVLGDVGQFFEDLGATVTRIFNGIVDTIKGAIDDLVGFIAGLTGRTSGMVSRVRNDVGGISGQSLPPPPGAPPGAPLAAAPPGRAAAAIAAANQQAMPALLAALPPAGISAGFGGRAAGGDGASMQDAQQQVIHQTTVNAPVTVTTVAADPQTVAYQVSGRIARLATT